MLHWFKGHFLKPSSKTTTQVCYHFVVFPTVFEMDPRSVDILYTSRHGSRIWLREVPASEAKHCRCSEVESWELSKQSVPRVQGP